MKSIIISISSISMIALFSCNKVHTCECVKTMENVSTGEVTEYGKSSWSNKISERKAKNSCPTSQSISTVNGYRMSEVCELK